MASPSTRTELELLLDHAAWVRELALRLVRDPHRAEDLAQDVMVAALEAPPRGVRSVRAWLAGVLKNRIRESVRGDSRRAHRENEAARSEATASAGELVERMSAHRDVVEAVMELPEHYRDVLLRRYFDGQKPQAIADETGVPLTTVKTRLQRGLEQLRTELDRRHGGDGRAWLAALAPLVGMPAPIAPGAPGAAPVERGPVGSTSASPLVPAAWKTAGLAAGLAVATGGVLLVADRLGTRAPAAHPAPVVRGTNELARATELPASAERALAGPARETAQDAPVRPAERPVLSWAGSARGALQGRVLDLDGAPVPGVLVRFERDREATFGKGGGSRIALADGEGRFTLEGAAGSGLVRVDALDLVTVWAARSGGADASVAVVVAEVARVEGRVLDAQGLGVAGAHLSVALPEERRAALAQHLVRSSPLAIATETDADGRFVLERAPRCAGAVLVAERTDLGSARSELTGAAQEARDLVLAGGTSEASVEGRVVDPAGGPVAGARLFLAGREGRSDAAGLFRLPCERADQEGEPLRLLALHPDLGAVELFLAPDVAGVTPDVPGLAPHAAGVFQEVVLPGAPGSIAGRVVDPLGRPARGVHVWIEDPTPIGATDMPRGSSILLDRPTDEARLRSGPGSLECELAGRSGETWHRTRTDDDGRFRLEGLLPRAYALASANPERRLATEPTVARPGAQDVELVLGGLPLRPRRPARVLDEDGSPVAGVNVTFQLEAFRLERDGDALYDAVYVRAAGVSDESGRVWLEGLPTAAAAVRAASSGILPTIVPLDDATDELAIRVTRAARVQVELTGELEADAFELLDADGERLPLFSERGLDMLVLDRGSLVDGRSEVLGVAARARTLRLITAEGVVVEESVRLVPGRRNVLSR